MKRNILLFILSIVVVLGGLVYFLSQNKSAPLLTGKKPNIIFILTDDLDVNSIGYMPKLKSLITDKGTYFSDYFLNISLCCPSRTATLRGQYAHNTHISTNAAPDGGFERFHDLKEEDSTIASWLQSAGYKTVLFGKYLNGYPTKGQETYVPPGWSEWYAGENNAYRQFDYTLNENGKIASYWSAPTDYENDVLSQKASDFIKRTSSEKKPFFIYFATYSPHGPSTPAPRHASLFQDVKAPRTSSFNEQDISDKPSWLQDHPLLTQKQIDKIDEAYRKRLQSLQSVDDAIESLINTLKQTNQLDNTYIFFTSDNGFHMGQHRLNTGKNTAYEEDILVPLIVRGPGVVAGKKIDNLVGNIDLAPTFAELAGVSTPSFVDGRSMIPILNNQSPIWRSVFLLEHGPGVDSAENIQPADPLGILEPPDVLAAPKKAKKNQRSAIAKGFQGLRTKDYLYVEYLTGEKELYDLHKDPYELSSIASGADSNLINRLSTQLNKLKTCSAGSCRSAEE